MATHLVLPYQQEQPQAQQQESALRRAQWAAVGIAQGSGSVRSLYDQSNSTCGGAAQLTHGPASASEDTSWEVRAFAEDAASCSGQWPPRSYACSFCQREFRTAQALGGHMNVHRRERAQANQMALLRSSAQQAAAATTAPLNAVAAQAQWCLYSPMGVNPSGQLPITPPEGGAYFYSSLAPGGTLFAMASSPNGSSHITARSSPPSRFNTTAAVEGVNNCKSNNSGMFAPQISSPPYSGTSPLSSPLSQGSRSSGSSVVTKGSRGGVAYQSASSPIPVSQNSANANFSQKLQLGAFQPYQSSLFGPEVGLVTQELIHLGPEPYSKSPLLPKSMAMRGDDRGLDLELRLGPSMMATD